MFVGNKEIAGLATVLSSSAAIVPEILSVGTSHVWKICCVFERISSTRCVLPSQRKKHERSSRCRIAVGEREAPKSRPEDPSAEAKKAKQVCRLCSTPTNV